MYKKIVLIFLLIVSFNLYGQHLITGRSVKRGEILTAYVYPSENIVSSHFSLRNGQGRIVSDSEGFKYTVEEKGIETTLMGIPSDIAPGKYTLSVFCVTDEGSDQFTKSFIVTDRTYLHEDIRLNRTMTSLRSSDDPQKAEQSRRLWSLISEFDDQALFYDDRFQEPVKEYIESAFFGDRRNFIYSDGTKNQSLHNGSDFAAPIGEPVYSAGSGKIVMSENRIITGNTIIIEHLPGVYSLYYHLDSTNVETGMIVEKGIEIGKVGATGLVTGAHLHWELRVSKVAVDPLLYISNPLIDKDEIMDIIRSIH